MRMQSSRARVGACSMRSHPIENSRFSKKTRSRSYAKCCWLNVFADRIDFSNAVRLRGTLPRYNAEFLVVWITLQPPGRGDARAGSRAARFTYRAADKTLTDAEVNAAHDKVVEQFRQKLTAVIR